MTKDNANCEDCINFELCVGHYIVDEFINKINTKGRLFGHNTFGLVPVYDLVAKMCVKFKDAYTTKD